MTAKSRWFNVWECDGCVIASYCLKRMLWQDGEPEKKKIKEEMLHLLNAPQQQIVLDLSRVEYVSGDCIGMFIKFFRKAQAARSRVVFVCHSQIEEVFQVTKLDKIFILEETVDDAIDKLNSLPDLPIIVTTSETPSGVV